MGILQVMILFSLCCCCFFTPSSTAASIEEEDHQNGRQVIDVKGGPEDVMWVVQLSDLHFSVHNPERARDFKDLVGPSLSFINPSLVLITGDLTDGKSKDLLTMKQDEAKWVEYEKVMQDVFENSGLGKDIFYDVRGNHDAFGVPTIGGLFDFFSKHSINAQLGRSGQVNSVTVQTAIRKLLFVGLDSTMSVGLRRPTNLFGHPTDKLLAKIDYELSQWNSEPTKPVTKISLGISHFHFQQPRILGRPSESLMTSDSFDDTLFTYKF